MPRDLVASVLAQEVKLGRVVEEDGRYRLVNDRFAPDVLASLLETAGDGNRGVSPPRTAARRSVVSSLSPPPMPTRHLNRGGLHAR
jgi:hypothetical protein